MKIVYYVVLYLKKELKTKPGEFKVTIHLDPFGTQARAEAYKAQCEENYGDRLLRASIKKVDLSKYEDGVWLK